MRNLRRFGFQTGPFLILLLAITLTLLDKIKGNGDGIILSLNIGKLVFPLLILVTLFYIWYFIFRGKTFLQGLITTFFTLLFGIIFLEIATSFLVKKREQNIFNYQFEGMPKTDIDKKLGVVAPLDTSFQVTRTLNGNTLWKATYSFDKDRLRITPDSTGIVHDKYAQFYGCSFTFGWGVENDETLPYFFGKEEPEFKPYNFAYSGYGPHQMLTLLKEGKPKQVVKESEGIGVYIYIDDHIGRMIPGTRSYKRYESKTPYYTFENGNFIYKGLFEDIAFFPKFFYKLMSKSNIFKYFNLEYPFKIKAEDYDLAAKMVKASADLYKRQFGNDNFFVVIYPSPFPYQSNQIMVDDLKKEGLKVFDYSDFLDMKNPEYAIENDNHSTPLANQLVMEKFISDLKTAGYLK